MKLRIVSLPLMLLMLAYSCNAQSSHSAKLSWGASPTTGATYGIMRGTAPGGSKTKVATGVSALTFTDTPLAANSQFCYQVVAESAGALDSVPTNEVCGTTGKDQTQPPTGSLTVIFQ